MLDNLGFELYEIKKNNSGDVIYNKHDVILDESKIESIKDHIISFFENKNSYYKHMEKDELPKKWIKAFSNPINHIFDDKTSGSVDFDVLLDTFIKQGLSPQSFSFSRRSKFLLIIYKKEGYFILSHLSVKRGLTLENNSIELSKLLFYSDTLLRYIYISTGNTKKFDIVFWERQMTKRFIDFIGVGDDFLNKDYSGELLFFCEKATYTATIPYEPQAFLEKFINKEVRIEKKSKNYHLLLDGDNFMIKKVQIGDQVITDFKDLGNELFIIKLSINTSIRKSMSSYDDVINLPLPFQAHQRVIIEKEAYIEIGDDEVIKNNTKVTNENIINLGLPVKTITANDGIDFRLGEEFITKIITSISNSNEKKAIIFGYYDAYKIDLFHKDFSNIYKRLGIFFVNLNIDENIILNNEILPLLEFINKADSHIIKNIYKLLVLQFILSHLQDTENLQDYFKMLIDYQTIKIAEIKGEVFTETETNYIEYKSGLSVEIDNNWEDKVKAVLTKYVDVKLKTISTGFICIGFDEMKRTVLGIKSKYFRKFDDDSIYNFELYIRGETDVNEIRIYKITMGEDKNILLIYISK